MHIFAAILSAKILTREIWVRPTYACEFFPDPLRFARVIREKLILSKYILRCHAYARQRIQQELIRRLDSERELLRSAPRKLPEFAEITQNNGHYAIQGHSRSPILIPIESSYTISY